MRDKSLISEAIERVSIIKVCRLIGMSVPDGGSGKTYCPFGTFNHSDGGKAKAFRIYAESNSAYCFSCRRPFDPVSLYSEIKDISRFNAALDLLEMIGWKPVSLAHRWAEAAAPEQHVDTSMLGLALRTYCARVCPDWADRQLEPATAGLLGRCLGLLDRVRTAEDADRWLTACKQVMLKSFGAGKDD